MKKHFALLLSFSLMLSLAACNKQQNDPVKQDAGGLAAEAGSTKQENLELSASNLSRGIKWYSAEDAQTYLELGGDYETDESGKTYLPENTEFYGWLTSGDAKSNFTWMASGEHIKFEAEDGAGGKASYDLVLRDPFTLYEINTGATYASGDYKKTMEKVSAAPFSGRIEDGAFSGTESFSFKADGTYARDFKSDDKNHDRNETGTWVMRQPAIIDLTANDNANKGKTYDAGFLSIGYNEAGAPFIEDRGVTFQQG